MRAVSAMAVAACTALAACADFKPTEATLPVSEMPRNAPGLVSGTDGVFTIIGPTVEPALAASGG